MILNRELRQKLQAVLPFKLKVNDCIRIYLKQEPTFENLISYIKQHKNCKRKEIPANMHYNNHVKVYWQKNSKGTHKQCVDQWNQLQSE